MWAFVKLLKKRRYQVCISAFVQILRWENKKPLMPDPDFWQ